MSTKPILVPTDFTEVAHTAINHAVELAKTIHSSVVILHVVKNEAEIAEISEKLEEEVKLAKSIEGDVEVTSLIKIGNIFDINLSLYNTLQAANIESYLVLTSTRNKGLPTKLQSQNLEIRVMMPRFGMINERRHRLHEVVRLSGINVVVNDEDYPLIIKVASLPGARLQVYFLDNDGFEVEFTEYLSDIPAERNS